MAGLALDILKVESWMQMGRTANIIIKYNIHVFASTCKNMRILLMGRRYRERWMACHLIGNQPLSEPMLAYCQLDP